LGLNTFWLLRNIYSRQLIETYPVNASFRRAATIWQVANEYGLEVGVVNWWPSWPADTLQGFMITNQVDEFVTMESRLASSPNLTNTPEELTSPPELLGEVVSLMNERGWTRLGTKNWMRLGLELFRERQVDLFLIYIPGPDGIQHETWDAYEPNLFRKVSRERIAQHGNDIPNAYRKLDQLLGETLNVIGEDVTIIIVSDHGASPFFAINPMSPWKGGHEHCPPGIFIAAGPGVKKGVEVTDASILDVAPTVLTLLGLPIARSMDGSVLTDILSPDISLQAAESVPTWDYLVVPRDAPLDPALRQKEESRLKALGYIR
jgi:predicted AlkP superfamily phosphohydrolase/phosphomutase